MSRYFLGIDVSTTGAKALLIDEKGTVAASATTALTLQTPKPLWSEQDPHEWWKGTAASIRKALAEAGAKGEDVAAVGLTGQMHGLVLLDARARGPPPRHPLERPADRRRVRRDREARREERSSSARSATSPSPASPRPKILWVRNHEPEVYAKAKLVLLPKDYVRLRLTGEAAMDKADGSGTILFELKARTWSKLVLEKLDIPAEWLPPTFEGPETTGTVTAEAAAETGLQAGTPVMAGGGDQAAGAVGAGAVRPGVVSLTLGTSGVVFATTDAPLVEPEGRLHAFCHAVPGRWHFMGVTLSAAGSLQWYHDTLTPKESFADIVAEAEQAPAGSEGLLFLPYLSGERTPYPDPLARGSFVGLTLRHPRAHLTRAVLEGVAFSMKDCFSLLQGAGLGRGEGGPDRRRRGEGPAVAEDRGERPRPADGHRQQHGGRGLRGGAPRRRRRRRLADASRPRATRRSPSPAATSRSPSGRRPTRPSTPATASCTRRSKPTYDALPG